MMHTKTIAELSKSLDKGEFSSVELTKACLQHINDKDKNINSFITLTPEYALHAAEKADIARKEQKAGPLTGIPIAHKDIFCTKGIKTSCGSKMLDNFISPYDATVVSKFK